MVTVVLLAKSNKTKLKSSKQSTDVFHFTDVFSIKKQN